MDPPAPEDPVSSEQHSTVTLDPGANSAIPYGGSGISHGPRTPILVPSLDEERPTILNLDEGLGLDMPWNAFAEADDSDRTDYPSSPALEEVEQEFVRTVEAMRIRTMIPHRLGSLCATDEMEEDGDSVECAVQGHLVGDMEVNDDDDDGGGGNLFPWSAC